MSGVLRALLAESCKQVALHTLFINSFPDHTEITLSADMYWNKACNKLGRTVTMPRNCLEVVIDLFQSF
jgi:hypothetical protein